MLESSPERNPLSADGHSPGWLERRRVGVLLLRRLVIYHSILALCLLLATAAFPGLTRHLPIGGVSKLVEAGELTVGKANETARPPETIIETASAVTNALDRLGTGRQLVLILIGTWLLMLPVSWVHKCIHRSSEHDHSLDETVLILPGIVAGLVLVVQHSLALAFSLAGIVAGVQFRRALQDTFDALFILVAIGTGIAAGVRALEIAAVITVFFCYSTLFVHYFGDGFESDFLAKKKAEKKLRKQAQESSEKVDEDD